MIIKRFFGGLSPVRRHPKKVTLPHSNDNSKGRPRAVEKEPLLDDLRAGRRFDGFEYGSG